MAHSNNVAAFQILDTKEGVQWRQFHFGHARLESSTKTSIFLAAFGMSIMTSFQFTSPSHAPSWIVTLLSVNTVILIAMHSFAFVIGTCLLPQLAAVDEEYNPPQTGQTLINPVPSFSPHERFSGFIGASHRISHVFGLFVFLIEVPLVAWVKFWDISKNAAIASTVAIVPFMVLFAVFCWFFNFEYNTHLYQNRQDLINEVEKNYKCASRESLAMSTFSEEIQESPEIVLRRHSLHANFRVGTPAATRRSCISMQNVTLEPVVEQIE